MDGSYVPMAESVRGRNGLGDSRLARMLAFQTGKSSFDPYAAGERRIGFRARVLDWLVEP